MWKKENTTPNQEEKKETQKFENSFSRPEPVSNPSTRTDTASIGHTINIDGKIGGDEDLIVQGKIKGEIKLSKHTLSVGRNGNINASILAKIIKIDGEVRGDIEGSERVIINESGRVYGNIKSPRVILKDGSRFKGNIDMQQNDENKLANTNQAGSAYQSPYSAKSNSNPSNNAKQVKKSNPPSGSDHSSSNSNHTDKLNASVDKERQEKKKIDLRNL